MSNHIRYSKTSHTVRNVVLVILLFVAVIACAVGVTGYRFYKQAMEVKDHELAAVQTLTDLQDVSKLNDSAALRSAIAQAQKHTAAAEMITESSLWKVASNVPLIGADVQNVRGMVSVMNHIAAQSLPKLDTAIQSLVSASLSGTDGTLNLQPVIQAQQSFSQISSDFDQQTRKLDGLPQPSISMVQNAYSVAQTELKTVSNTLEQVSDSMRMLPVFLGVNTPRNYLLVANTPSELRSGGGLIGSVGTMNASGGAVIVGAFHSNKELIPYGSSATPDEHALFSSPLQFSFDVRDIFATPDFSRTAEMLNAIWQRSAYATPVDGVIAIDPVFIQKMVQINGNVTLPNGTILTGDNTAEYMLNTIYKEVPVSLQDGYFETIATAVMDSAFKDMNLSKMMKIAQVIPSMAHDRHLYIYSFHDDEAKYFQNAGLAQGTPSSERNPEVGIYLNEQNPSKLGWYLKRKTDVTRTACNGDGSQTYHVRFSMTNSLTEQEMASATPYILGGGPMVAPGVQVERILFYAPAGGSLSNLTSTGKTEQTSETTMDGKALTTSVAYIAPGKTVTYEFDVTTSPKAITDLSVDQTPAGQSGSEVTLDTDVCAIKSK